MHNWSDYYERVKFTVPAPLQTTLETFLQPLPSNAKILDVGAGNCRFALAMRERLPDAIIHTLDNNAEAKCYAERSGFPFIECDLKNFSTHMLYNGIWAMGVLFFLDADAIPSLLKALSNALAPQGTIFFSMVEPTPTASRCGFSGMNEPELRTALKNAKLEVMDWQRSASKYGRDAIAVPTSYIMARKAS